MMVKQSVISVHGQHTIVMPEDITNNPMAAVTKSVSKRTEEAEQPYEYKITLPLIFFASGRASASKRPTAFFSAFLFLAAASSTTFFSAASVATLVDIHRRHVIGLGCSDTFGIKTVHLRGNILADDRDERSSKRCESNAADMPSYYVLYE